ncbi:MAG: GNAT family N-acetyltransferase [Acidimicrobiia bacterium]
MKPIEVRRIRADEWDMLRSIRLCALEESPLSFITTLGEARAHPQQLWVDRAHAGAVGPDQITMVAVRGSDAVGLAIGLRRRKPPLDVVPVVSVFVRDAVRRQGVAGSLMNGVETWAREGGATTTSLWVVEGNGDARAFYEQRGYIETLDRKKIRVPPERWERRFEKPLEVPAS